MDDVTRTQYALADDGVSLAYQMVGDGPIDLIFVPRLGQPPRLGLGVLGLCASVGSAGFLRSAHLVRQAGPRSVGPTRPPTDA